MPNYRTRSGTSEPDPFRVADMLGELLDGAQEFVYLATSADVWSDHAGQDVLRKADYPERWAICSNRWGKSDWGARECRYWLLGDHPYLKHRITLPSLGWAVSDTLDNGREIVLPKLIRHIPYEAVRHYPTRENRNFELTNGSKLGLKSCEQGRGAFQGADKTFIWWDDIEGDNPELAWECYKEGGMRIGAGRVLYQWGTMTPLCGMSGLIESIEEREKLGHIFVVRGAIYDNPHLSRDAIDRALSGLTEEWELAAREQGKVTLLGGGHVFPMSVVQARAQADEPVHMLAVLEVDLETQQWRFNPALPGVHSWKIWDLPKPGRRYVCFVDPAGGDQSKEADWTVIKVFDAQAWAEVACLRAKIGPAQTATYAAQVSKLYNFALLGIEANAMGLGVIEQAREQYPNLYRRHQVADVVPKSSQKLGWYTSETLKEKMIKDLAELVSGGHIDLKEKETWREMLRFVRDAKGRLGAQRGHHDDGIMCAAGAIQLLLSPHLGDYFKQLHIIGVEESNGSQ